MNKRVSINSVTCILTTNGEYITLAQACKEMGMKRANLTRIIKRLIDGEYVRSTKMHRLVNQYDRIIKDGTAYDFRPYVFPKTK